MDNKSIIQDIKNKQFKPIYLLHGEEPYYIDLISKSIIENALEDHERDFNQMVFYGIDSEVLSIISEAKGYPMMAERRLVVIREAQDLKDFEMLEKYCAKPEPTTVLVIMYKGKKFDSRKKIFKDISKSGLVYGSDKLRDYQLVDWINNYLKTTEFSITPKATSLLADYLGNDLSKIINELDKFKIFIKDRYGVDITIAKLNTTIDSTFNKNNIVLDDKLRNWIWDNFEKRFEKNNHLI